MTEFDISKHKDLEFKASLEGVPRSNIRIRFVIESNGIEYGFIGSITGNIIKVTVPKLKTVFDGDIPDSQKLKARLDITSDDKFFQVWSEEIIVKRPQNISVELMGTVETNKANEATIITVDEVGNTEQAAEVVVKKKTTPSNESERVASSVDFFLSKLSKANG